MKYLEVKKEGHICWVYLNRPEAMNALSTDVLKEIADFNFSLRDDLESRVVIYAGKGDHFSAGADLKEKPKKVSKLEAWRNNFGKPAIYSFFEVNQITIAAIDGYCLGGAACIATACDFRIASEDAILGYPEINLGINLNWFGLPLAVRLIGPARAKKMVIGGENENAETLLSGGFYDEVHPKKDLMNAAKQMADLYCSKPPMAAQMIKHSVNELVYSGDDAIMHMDYDQTLLTHETQDRREALLSFFEKRDPKFTGD